jgi:hypothetical protein
MANETGGVSAISNPFAPDVFADEAVGFEFINGTVRISFGVVKMADPVPPSENQLVVMGRVVMPMDGARRLAERLTELLAASALPAEAQHGGQVH